MTTLAGKVIIITGAGSGIGRGCAQRFARDGAQVTIAEFDADAGRDAEREIAAAGGQALFVETDVTDKAQMRNAVDATVERFGGVHGLMNNAWSNKTALARVEWLDDDTMDSAFAVSTMSSLWAMSACLPHMRAQGFGRVLSICSLNGVNAHMFSAHYNSVRESLRALTRTAACEWAGWGITCNIICPAAKTASHKRFADDNPELAERLEKAVPMGYIGDPERDIAPVAAFVMSEESRYMTGNTLFVDGGSHVNGSPWKPELPETPPAEAA